jgi:hypothetical protein
VNSSALAARRDVREIASVRKLLYSVLVSVCVDTVEACVTENDVDDVCLQYFVWTLVQKYGLAVKISQYTFYENINNMYVELLKYHKCLQLVLLESLPRNMYV